MRYEAILYEADANDKRGRKAPDVPPRRSARIRRGSAPQIYGRDAELRIFPSFDENSAPRVPHYCAPDLPAILRARVNFMQTGTSSVARSQPSLRRIFRAKKKNRFPLGERRILLLTNKIFGVSYLTRINELFIILSNLNC